MASATIGIPPSSPPKYRPNFSPNDTPFSRRLKRKYLIEAFNRELRQINRKNLTRRRAAKYNDYVRVRKIRNQYSDNIFQRINDKRQILEDLRSIYLNNSNNSDYTMLNGMRYNNFNNKGKASLRNLTRKTLKMELGVNTNNMNKLSLQNRLNPKFSLKKRYKNYINDRIRNVNSLMNSKANEKERVEEEVIAAGKALFDE